MKKKKWPEFQVEYENLLKSMFTYIQAHEINPYARMEIEEDCIQMMQDAQLREIPPEEVFSDGYQTFCDEVIASALQRSFSERILSWVIYVLFTLATMVLSALISGENVIADGDFLITLDAFSQGNVFIVIAIVPTYFYRHHKVTKENYSGIGWLVSIEFVLLIVGTIIEKMWISDVLRIPLPILYVAAILLAASMISYRYLQKLHWKQWGTGGEQHTRE